MAQAEDTELRDLVINALEKNGSLAKVRALLRANIFLTFEEECQNMKQNETLDKILHLPEGKFCLSIIHEFLEFCNLKNTLFVYKSESRQNKDYGYDNLNSIAEKLNLAQPEREKEPLLLTIIKTFLKPVHRNNLNQNDKHNNVRRPTRGKSNFNNQNSTYIVNDSSNTTSHTQSDNSSDEKNKLDLRLTLDNSDTDTSSDSTRGRTSSEYIPNMLVNTGNIDKSENSKIIAEKSNNTSEMVNYNYVTKTKDVSDDCLRDLKIINNSSTESTSYVELKPFNLIDTVLLNTPGLPLDQGTKNSKEKSPHNSNSTGSKIESLSLVPTLNSNTESNKNISLQQSKASTKNLSGRSEKYDTEASEYSYDFTSPPSARKDSSDKLSPKSILEDVPAKNPVNISPEANLQSSQSSQSSVSLSDVADLISDKSNSKRHSRSNIFNEQKFSNKNLIKSPRDIKILSDDSGDFSESPIPSISNLSLDIHSD